jgi:nucleotide-binding universal stress UspA family protein
MRILHPTDFSDASNAAGRAAAHLAVAWRMPLHLLHVAHLPGVSAGTAAMAFKPSTDELARRRKQLEHLEKELRAIGAEVVSELVEGLPDEVVLERCASIEAALLVIGPTGDRRRVAFGLGSTAMRLIKTSPVPTLVVRDEACLESWTKGQRPLRVAVGLDPSRPARLALNWLGSWTAIGPLAVVALHVYDPELLSGVSAVTEKQQFLLEDLDRRLGAEVRVKGARARLVAGGGRVTPHLLDACAAENSDLLVIGTHPYSSIDRILRGSTSLDIVAASTRNVVTVPIAAGAALSRATPKKVERILVPLDFSDAARRALPWACALVAHGGQLQLLHVCTIVEGERPTDMVARARAELEAVDPAKWDRGDLRVRREVLLASNVPKEIVRMAAEWEADLICMASHGRSGLSRVLMGSVTAGVLRRADRPVVAVPAHADS